MKIKRVNLTGKHRPLRFDLNNFEKRVILNEVFYSRNYFPKISSKLDFKINPNDTVIDIGANAGIFSVFAADAANRGRVYSFEPVKENFERLKHHVFLNHFRNVTAADECVSDRRKKATIYLIKKNSGGHSLHKNKFKKYHEKIRSAETVSCIPLKTIFDRYKIRHCDFLKIDAEGEEYAILNSLPRNYFSRIDKIALEFHATVVDETMLMKLLIKRGFVVTVSYLYGHLLGMIFAKRKTNKHFE